jgi:hypothetical protein
VAWVSRPPSHLRVRRGPLTHAHVASFTPGPAAPGSPIGKKSPPAPSRPPLPPLPRCSPRAPTADRRRAYPTPSFISRFGPPSYSLAPPSLCISGSVVCGVLGRWCRRQRVCSPTHRRRKGKAHLVPTHLYAPPSPSSGIRTHPPRLQPTPHSPRHARRQLHRHTPSRPIRHLNPSPLPPQPLSPLPHPPHPSRALRCVAHAPLHFLSALPSKLPLLLPPIHPSCPSPSGVPNQPPPPSPFPPPQVYLTDELGILRRLPMTLSSAGHPYNLTAAQVLNALRIQENVRHRECHAPLPPNLLNRERRRSGRCAGHPRQSRLRTSRQNHRHPTWSLRSRRGVWTMDPAGSEGSRAGGEGRERAGPRQGEVVVWGSGKRRRG